MYDPKPNFLCELFDKLVLPILMYGCEVWGFSKADQVERVHTSFCKSVLRIRRSSANYFCYGELGRKPLRVLRISRIIKFWLDLITDKKGTVMYKLYKLMYDASEANRQIENWASLVKNSLCNLGFLQVWLQQGVGDKQAFLRICKQRLSDQYFQEWCLTVNNSADGILYRCIKTTLEYSDYMNKIDVSKYRNGLTKFLTRNHRLTIITERWARGRPYEERFCDVCNILDDEYHCIIECRKYAEHPYFTRRPSMRKFVQLLTCERKRTLLNLSMFIVKANIC